MSSAGQAAETLEQLLQRHVDEDTYSFSGFARIELNTRGHEDETPLHRACYRGNPRIVKLPLAAGADVAADDKFGGTALSIARSHPDIPDLLLRRPREP